MSIWDESHWNRRRDALHHIQQGIQREVYKLKNVLMQIDLSMISMRKNVAILEKKLKLLKHPTNKKLKEVKISSKDI